MKYSDLNLKINTDYNIASIGNNEIKVLKYLPTNDKIDLIQIALQKANEGGVYNEIKLDMYFNLYLVYMYSDLEFSEEEKNDEFKLYDELNCNNIIISIIGAMEDDEYDNLISYLTTMKENNEKHMLSTAALFQTFIQDMPKNAAAAAEIVDNFDKTKYQNVIDFAKSANGNRPIE